MNYVVDTFRPIGEQDSNDLGNSSRRNIIQRDSSSFVQESERGKRISPREVGSLARIAGASRGVGRPAGRERTLTQSGNLSNCEAA